MTTNLNVNGIVMTGYPVFADLLGVKAFSTKRKGGGSCLRFTFPHYFGRVCLSVTPLLLGLYIPNPSIGGVYSSYD